jgi:hypothetical protein
LMETVCSSDTLISKYFSAWRQNPDQHWHILCRENLRSHTHSSVYPPADQSIHPLYQSNYPSIHLRIYLSIYLSINLSNDQWLRLLIYLPICLSGHLSIRPSISSSAEPEFRQVL